VKIITIKMKI